MSSVKRKVDYVLKNLNNPTGHTCHWPGCKKKCPPTFWGCREHWFMLPNEFRQAIWKHYRPGQEQDKKPSPDYVRIALAVQKWIRDNEPSS